MKGRSFISLQGHTENICKTITLAVILIMLSAGLASLSFATEKKQSAPNASRTEKSFQDGVLLFNNSEFQKAYDVFSKLVRKDPSNMDLNFYLGRSAYESGDYETAIFAYDRMLIQNPELHRIKLEMARAYIQLGSYDEAERLFNEVLSTNPPQEVQDNIGLYLENITASRKNHNFKGNFLIGTAYDDNAYAAPVSETIKIPALDDLPVVMDSLGSDYYYEMAANIGYAYVMPSKTTALTAEVQSYQTRYNEYDDLELDYVVFKAGPVIRFDNSELEIFGTGSYMNLDQNDYFSGYGIGSSFTMPVWAEQLLSTRFICERRDFNDLDERNVYSTLFAVGIITPVYGLFDLKSDVAYIRENAEAGYYSFHRGAANFVLSRKLLGNLVGSLGYSFEASYYDADDPSFSEERQDDTHYLRAGVSYRFGGNRAKFPVELGVVNTYVKSDSNIELYEYEKNTIRAFTSVSF